MGILRDCWRKEGSLQVVRAMQSHLSSHHPDKYAGESSKESQSQRKLAIHSCMADLVAVVGVPAAVVLGLLQTVDTLWSQ